MVRNSKRFEGKFCQGFYEVCQKNVNFKELIKSLPFSITLLYQHFLHSFFRAYPHHQMKFQRFSSLPLDELPQNKRFQAHTFTAVSTLNSLLTTLDDEDMFDEMIRKIGENHIKRHGVVQADFMVIFMQILCMLKTFKIQISN